MSYLFTLVIIVVLVFPFNINSNEEEAKIVKVENIKSSNLVSSERLIGVVQAKYSSTIKAKTNGTIQWIAESGQQVKAGQPILKLDNDDISNTYNLAKDKLAIVTKKYNRSQELAHSNLVTKAWLADEQVKLLEAQTDLQNAKNEFDKYIFIAPFDCIIGLAKFRVGSQIKENDELLTIYKPNELIIEVSIPDNLVNNINVGQKVIVNAQELKLSALQKSIDLNTHMAPAYINYECNKCVIGQAENIDIILSEKTNIITIPRYAIIIKEGKPSVFIVKETKAKLINVELGDYEKKMVEIKSGLKVGDQLIISGFQNLSDEQSVQIIKE